MPDPHSPTRRTIVRSLVSRLLLAAAPVALVVALLVGWVASPLLRTPGDVSRAEADLLTVQRYQSLLTLVDNQSLHWVEYQYLPRAALPPIRTEIRRTTAGVDALKEDWVAPPAAAAAAFAAYDDLEKVAQLSVAAADAGEDTVGLHMLTDQVLPASHTLRGALKDKLLDLSVPLSQRFSELSGNVRASFLGAPISRKLKTARYEIDQVLGMATLEDLVIHEASDYAEVIATGNAYNLNAIRSAALVDRELANLAGTLPVGDQSEERPTLDSLASDHTEMTDTGERIRALVRGGQSAQAAVLFEARLDTIMVDHLLPLISTQVAVNRKDLATEIASLDALARRLRVEVALGGLILLLVLVFPIVSIARSTVHPLRKIRRAAEAISSGDLAARTGVKARSEVGELAQAFDVMAGRVEESRASLLSAAVLESSSDLLLIVREDIVRYVSGASTSLLGLPPEALLDRPLATLIHPDDQDLVAAWPHGEITENIVAEVRFAVPTGWVETEIAIADLRGDPEVDGLVFSVRDVTARKQVEVELAAARDAALEASRMKSDFLATMSHEIRTPMNGVIGLTGLLLTTELNERQVQYAEGVRGAGEALLGIINDILDFSKVEAGRLDLEDIDFDLVQVIEEAAVLVADAAQQKDVELLAYCSPDLPLAVRGDPSRIRQVLLNLVSNAVKFTDQGEVVVRGLLEDRQEQGVVVRFEVADTGAGIPEAGQQRLFDPFTQADSSTTREFGGTGLGLAISHRLVTAMGGTLGVDSEVGTGSTFWFTLPLGLSRNPTAPPVRTTGRLTGLRALIVDDNQTNRLILTEQLGAWGIRTDAVASGSIALAYLREAADIGQPYDLALLDLCMPRMDGLELAGRISGDPDLVATGLLLLTSAPDLTLEQAAAAGITESLTKPVRLSQLHAALQSTYARRRGVDPGAPPAPVVPASAGRGHVLVAEDHATNQLVAVGILEGLGFTSEVAANGLEALQALARTTFAAVLMDCHMPIMDGYTATAQIRRDQGTAQHTPIIAMTAGAVQGDRERCLESGMDDYVSKPVTPESLDTVLTHWLTAPRDRVQRDTPVET